MGFEIRINNVPEWAGGWSVWAEVETGYGGTYIPQLTRLIDEAIVFDQNLPDGVSSISQLNLWDDLYTGGILETRVFTADELPVEDGKKYTYDWAANALAGGGLSSNIWLWLLAGSFAVLRILGRVK